jgi:predicted nucleic acid-binding protein
MGRLLDTGVLLRLYDRDAPERDDILRSLRVIYQRDEQIFVAMQNIAEFWNVMTRPMDVNGFGQSTETARRRLQSIEKFATVLTESDDSYRLWKQFVDELVITGVKVHDARLVAVMTVNGVTQLLTLNERDFRRFDSIVAMTPAALVSQ